MKSTDFSEDAIIRGEEWPLSATFFVLDSIFGPEDESKIFLRKSVHFQGLPCGIPHKLALIQIL
jgi:hypothetical protein